MTIDTTGLGDIADRLHRVRNIASAIKVLADDTSPEAVMELGWTMEERIDDVLTDIYTLFGSKYPFPQEEAAA